MYHLDMKNSQNSYCGRCSSFVFLSDNVQTSVCSSICWFDQMIMSRYRHLQDSNYLTIHFKKRSGQAIVINQALSTIKQLYFHLASFYFLNVAFFPRIKAVLSLTLPSDFQKSMEKTMVNKGMESYWVSLIKSTFKNETEKTWSGLSCVPEDHRFDPCDSEKNARPSIVRKSNKNMPG